MTQPKFAHLSYILPKSGDRFYFYENYWKRVALRLLEQKAGDIRGWSFLDYGCGRGESMAYAKERGMQVRGLDVDPECVRLASQYGEAEVLHLNQPEIQVPPKSFDVIACFHVLEHVENPKSVLTLLGRGARKYVLVAVPNLGRFPNLRRPWKKPAFVNRGHLQSWDHDHFKTLCEVHCGLRVVDWGFDATVIPPFSEILRCLGGENLAIFMETKVFRYLFPYAGISIIALLAPDLAPAD